ncbi:MAG: D-glycero-beta-D-manno-heptose 1-phosphate adenylyltransferase [Candidatus Omnitrophica bacterium]|nr:D-glycero-beta-D-manno-heptose 1-phosphate adenylyltransferase [Candidatus Omnitrophota bacterium]
MRTHRRVRQLKDKILPLSRLKKVIAFLQKKGARIVFTNGCFDILHYGHASYLEHAKRKGDILVVAVNSDSSIKKIKGPHRPVNPQQNRLRMVAALESVDYVTVFSQVTPLEVIKLLKPTILVKGADWDKQKIVGKEEVERTGGKVCSIPLVQGLSTTNLLKKISDAY